jgi:hypothetical protein
MNGGSKQIVLTPRGQIPSPVGVAVHLALALERARAEGAGVLRLQVAVLAPQHVERVAELRREEDVALEQPKVAVTVGVTGMGEFSPIGRMFAMGNFFLNYTSSPNFGASFHCKNSE